MDPRRGIRAGLVAGLVCLVAASSASAAPPANDNFSAATALSGDGEGSLLSQTTIDATAETGEPAHAGQGPTRSVWYSFAPDAAGLYRIRACPAAGNMSGGTIALAVYTGAALNALTSIGGATDSEVSSCITPATVQFCASPGTTYRVAVDDTTGRNFNLLGDKVAAAPANDSFAAPAPLAASLTETTRCATAEGGEPAHAGVGPVHSVWYSFTPDATGLYRIRACPAASNTSGGTIALAVYTGAALNALTEVGSDTDFETFSCTTPATVELCVTPPAAYRVAVDDTTGRVFNLLPAGPNDIDEDGDCVEDADDQCPSLVGSSPEGCPTVARQLSLRYASRVNRFKGRLGPAGPCRSGEEVTVYRKRRGPDRVIGSDFTGDAGRYRVRWGGRRGTYYAIARRSVEPTQGICSKARSPNRRIS